MGNKMALFLVNRQQSTDNGDDYGFHIGPIMATCCRHTKMEPFMAPLMATMLTKLAGIDVTLHDKTFEPLICPAKDVTDVCD